MDVVCRAFQREPWQSGRRRRQHFNKPKDYDFVYGHI